MIQHPNQFYLAGILLQTSILIVSLYRRVPNFIFHLFEFGMTKKEALDWDGRFLLPGILTSENCERLPQSLDKFLLWYESKEPQLKLQGAYAAEYDNYLASLIAHPQMPILVHTVLGFDIRFDHCGTPSRRLGTSGIGWHSHKYADDQPQLGLILIFFYVNGFSPNDRALKVVSGSHHYRDLAISSNTNQQLCVGWVNNKKYSLTLQIHLCYFSMGYLSRAYEYDKSNCQLYEVLSYS